MTGSDALVCAIVTSHNRRDLTLGCLEAYFAQQVRGVRLVCVVCDDGSSDGTALEVRRRYGNRVVVVEGDGHLYWAAGMAMAERCAVRLEPDHLLWLNDDTVLDDDCLRTLLETAAQYPNAIIVGATRDPDLGFHTYGGRVRQSRWHVQRMGLQPVSGAPQEVDTFNGNIVLVPFSVRREVGPIDDLFPHSYADEDYGLRAGARGVPLIQAPGTLGTCSPNVPAPDGLRGLRAWRHDQHPKQRPIQAQVRFWHRHGGDLWPLFVLGQTVNRLLGRTPEGSA